MRVQLLRDKPAIEQLLTRTTTRHDTSTLMGVEALCRLYDSLDQYSYVRNMRCTLDAERSLQQRAQAAFATLEEQLLLALPTLRVSRHEHRARQLYSIIKHVHRDAILDTAFENLDEHAALQRIDEYKAHVTNLFQNHHVIGDKQLLKDLHLLYEITTSVRSEHSAKIASHNLLRFIKREADNLKHNLVRHGRDIATATVSHSRLENDELIRLYLNDCIDVENYLNRISTIAATSEKPKHHELIIGMRCDNTCDDLAKTLANYGTVHRLTLIPYLILETDDETATSLIARPHALTKTPITIYKPRLYTVNPIPAQHSDDSWNIDIICARDAWRSTRGEGTKVAVIDTGIDYNHPDLAKRFSSKRGANFVDDDEPLDDNGHGTHVAGTIAGEKTGVAPETTLYAVKVLDMNGMGSETAVLRGMEWAITNHADVLNMSLGSSYPSDAEASLITIATERGIAVACAAGNDGDSSYNYPASHPGAISVAAIDRSKQHAIFSNHNDRVAVCAPGVGVTSTWLGGGYETLSGTSMATPHVAGGCALLRLSDKTAGDVLKDTASRLGDKEYYGAGLINLAEAVK